jgi:hypothetical protein
MLSKLIGFVNAKNDVKICAFITMQQLTTTKPDALAKTTSGRSSLQLSLFSILRKKKTSPGQLHFLFVF